MFFLLFAGTSTVLVSVADENDVPPKFAKQEWTVEIKEELEPSTVLASLSVIDPDVRNNFAYRVSISS